MILWRLILNHRDFSLDFDLPIEIQLDVIVDVTAAIRALLTFSLQLLKTVLTYVAVSTWDNGKVDIFNLEANLALTLGCNVHKHCFYFIGRPGR